MSNLVKELRKRAEDHRVEHEHLKTSYAGNDRNKIGGLMSAGPVNQFYLKLAIEYDRRADEWEEWERKMVEYCTLHVSPVQRTDARTLLTSFAILGQVYREQLEKDK